VLGLAPRGFFIPYRHAAAARPADYPALRPRFEQAEASFAAVMAAIEAQREALLRIAAEGPARFDQDWFPCLDAAAAYALVRRERPRRIVEVGSGHSTRFLARAVADEGLGADILCIDPAPRAGIGALGVRHAARVLGQGDEHLFEGLRPGDILFVDSSHVAMPGTDLDHLFLGVLPRLPRGVIVHIHDVFLPDRYPAEWDWRGYNEQLLVGALIQGGGYDIVFASRYVATRRPDLVADGIVARLPRRPGACDSSLWLRKR
jgi:predicted O-methyltransferase YrrM